MKRLARLLTVSLAIPCSVSVAAPADFEAMQQRLEQLEALVGTLRAELDAERAVRQRVEVNTWVRPVIDGKSLKMQSPSGDFSFQMGGRVEADFTYYNQDRRKLGDGTDFAAAASMPRARCIATGTGSSSMNSPTTRPPAPTARASPMPTCATRASRRC